MANTRNGYEYVRSKKEHSAAAERSFSLLLSIVVLIRPANRMKLIRRRICVDGTFMLNAGFTIATGVFEHLRQNRLR